MTLATQGPQLPTPWIFLDHKLRPAIFISEGSDPKFLSAPPEPLLFLAAAPVSETILSETVGASRLDIPAIRQHAAPSFSDTGVWMVSTHGHGPAGALGGFREIAALLEKSFGAPERCGFLPEGLALAASALLATRQEQEIHAGLEEPAARQGQKPL